MNRSERNKVLVVDDEFLVLETMVDFLETLGFEPVAASDAETALGHLARDREIGVLVTDVRMPGMNGVELARRARAVRPDLKVLLASGYTHMAELDLPLLAKPFTMADLRRALTNVGVAA
jgi:CheY-like chemotaxis protein